MSNQKNITVNQHYISQGLIKLFSENKKIVYEYNVQNDKTYCVAIRKTMSGKKIYEHSALPENTLEKFFKSIEDDYIPAIKSIVALLDIKLLPPQNVYEKDLYAINKIVELIEKGYFECDGIGSVVSASLKEKEKIEQALDLAKHNTKFVFCTERECECHLFENKFSIGKIAFLSGKYIGDIDEWQRKIESFEEHDSREIHFRKSGNEKTIAFFADSCYLPSEDDVRLIKVSNLPINLEFIRFM